MEVPMLESLKKYCGLVAYLRYRYRRACVMIEELERENDRLRLSVRSFKGAATKRKKIKK